MGSVQDPCARLATRPCRFCVHAPAAGFGDEEFYPDLFDKAAVLVYRIAWNDPLPDRNDRAASACLVMFHPQVAARADGVYRGLAMILTSHL